MFKDEVRGVTLLEELGHTATQIEGLGPEGAADG